MWRSCTNGEEAGCYADRSLWMEGMMRSMIALNIRGGVPTEILTAGHQFRVSPGIIGWLFPQLLKFGGSGVWASGSRKVLVQTPNVVEYEGVEVIASW